MALKNARIVGHRCELVISGPLSTWSQWPSFLCLLRLQQVDPHLGELVEDIIDLLRGKVLRREELVQLVIRNVAPLFREPNHPPGGRISQV
jgi:hypothetical protein